MKQWEKFVKRCDFTLRDAAQTYTPEVGGLSFFLFYFLSSYVFWPLFIAKKHKKRELLSIRLRKFLKPSTPFISVVSRSESPFVVLRDV